MEGQSANFIESNDDIFGVQTTQNVSDDIKDLLFSGGSGTEDAKEIEPLEDEPKKKVTPKKQAGKTVVEEEVIEEEEEEKTDISLEDILGDEEKVEKEIEDTDDSKVEENNTFEALTTNLISLGIFSDTGVEPPKTPEQFRDRWFLEKNTQLHTDLQNFLTDKHGQGGLEAFNAIFVNGISPKDYMSKINQIQSFENIDITKEDNQKQIWREYQRRMGLKEDVIEARLQKVIDYGDLEDDAKMFQEHLIEQEQNELEQIVEQKQQQEVLRQQQEQQYLNSVQLLVAEKLKAKDFDGIPVTDKIAREVVDMMSTKKWKLPSGETITDLDKKLLELRDPKNLALKLKLGLLLYNNLDLSKVKINAVSKETDKLFNNLVIKDKEAKKRTALPTTHNSFF